MADRRAVLKGIIGAMRSVDRIQREQNALKMNLLQNSQKFQDRYFEKMMGNQMDIQKEKDLIPTKLGFEREKANIPRTAPLSQKDIIYSNISKIPENEWTPMQKTFMENYMGSGEQSVVDPQTGEVLYKRPKKSVFKPNPPRASGSEDMGFLGGEPQTTPSTIKIDGDQSSDLQAKADKARALGYTDEEINAYLKGQ